MNPDFRWIFQFSFGIETSIYYIKFRVYKIEICAFNRSIDAFKAHNNGISNQNLSETAQTPAKFVEKHYFSALGESCAWLYEKEMD